MTAFRALPARAGFAIDLFTQLFGNLLVFVYHCFDRIVIYGYLSGLSRPERVVKLFRQVVGVPVVSNEILSQRTTDYQNWVEAYARNHRIAIEWAEKSVRKEHHVLPWQRRMVRTNARAGVYGILKSMEQGPTFPASPSPASASSRCSCTAAVTSAAGPPGKSTRPSLATFHVSERAYGPNQLRYDLRKLKGHGLLQRDGSRYAYRLTPKGVQVALLFLFFHKRLRGPLANSRFHHTPVARHQPPSKLETAYHHADKAIQQIVDLLAA